MNSPLVAAIEQCLRQAAYNVALDVRLPPPAGPRAGDGLVPAVAIVAAKFYFCWRAFSYISQNIFVAELPDAGASHLDSLSAAGEHYSRQTRSPLSYLSGIEKDILSTPFANVAPRIKARGSYIVMPIVITKAPHPDILARCAARPRLTKPMFRLPAVIDADSGTLYYYRGSAIWGGSVLSEMRSVLSRIIAPSVEPAPVTP